MTAFRAGRPLSEASLLKAITLATFLMVVGQAVTVPVIPLYASSLGFAAGQVGLVVASFGFARLCLDFASGVLGDRFGLRRMVVSGCLVASSGALLSSASRNGTMLLLGQIISGVGSSIYNAAALMGVMVSSGAKNKARVLGNYHTAMIAGYATGPILGGIIADVSGYWAPFAVYAIFAVVVAIVLDRVVRSAGAESVAFSSGSTMRANLKVLFASAPFMVAIVVISSGYMVRSGIRDTAVPLFATETLAVGATLVGLLSGAAVVANAAVLPFAGRILDRVGRRPVTIWSCALTGVALTLLPFAARTRELMLVMMFLGIVSAFAGLAPVASIADVVDDRIAGTSVGLQRMAVDSGMVIGPLLAGYGFQLVDARSTFFIFAGLMFVVAALSSLAPETLIKRKG